MSRSLTKARELLRSTAELYALLRKQRTTAMQLFIHPDATANQAMRVQQELVRNHEFYRAAHHQVGELLVSITPRPNTEIRKWEEITLRR